MFLALSNEYFQLSVFKTVDLNVEKSAVVANIVITVFVFMISWFAQVSLCISVMDNCVTYKAVLLVKTVIVFCFLAVISSLTGFMLDLFVPKNRPCRLLQRNAIPSIITGEHPSFSNEFKRKYVAISQGFSK